MARLTASRRALLGGAASSAAVIAAPRSRAAERKRKMSTPESNKETVRRFIQVVWTEGKVQELGAYWTTDCVNHADPSPVNRGLDALRRYHEQFGQAFASFADVHIDISQQVAEGDRVVTQIATRAKQTALFMGLPATGKTATLATIRIDRFEGGKIAEHWSVADMAGMMQQLKA